MHTMNTAQQTNSTFGTESCNAMSGGALGQNPFVAVEDLMQLMPAGYVAYTGHVFTREQAASYNNFTRDIARSTDAQTRELLMNLRHAFFVSTTAPKQN
jgi:hypothetical protein